MVAAHRPDVALVDIKMPPTHTDEGLQAALTIKRAHSGTAVLLLSSYLDVRYASQLLESEPSSCGYLLKERVAHPAVLVDALKRVSSGECVLGHGSARRADRA
jgi:DNA-binding NarL/FixJ family response regulator